MNRTTPTPSSPDPIPRIGFVATDNWLAQGTEALGDSRCEVWLRVPRFLSRLRIPISGLLVVFLHLWCFHSFSPQFRQSETRPNQHRVHTKPSSNPQRSRQHVHTKSTPNPQQSKPRPCVQAEPRPCAGRMDNQPTQNPHQTDNAEDRQRTHGHTKPTRQQTLCAHHGAHQTQTKPRKRGQHARHAKGHDFIPRISPIDHP